METILYITLPMIVLSLILAGVVIYIRWSIRKNHVVFKSTLRRIHILEEVSTALFCFGTMILVGYALLALPIGY